MAKKKQRNERKRTVKRHYQTTNVDAKKQPPKKNSPESDKPRIAERFQEKDAGFGVIKMVVGILIVLILGSVIALKLSGGQDPIRGSKTQGDPCQMTKECASGSICFSYKDLRNRCLATCSETDACDPKYTCTSVVQNPGQENMRRRKVCIEKTVL
jgi:hypothetical protein